MKHLQRNGVCGQDGGGERIYPKQQWKVLRRLYEAHTPERLRLTCNRLCTQMQQKASTTGRERERKKIIKKMKKSKTLKALCITVFRRASSESQRGRYGLNGLTGSQANPVTTPRAK